MNDVEGECAWVPAGLTISDAVVASIFVMSLPDGIAVRFTEYKGVESGVRPWMRQWLQNRRDKYRREKPGELDVPAALFSLIVERSKSEDQYALVEARVSSYPAVPENWPELTHDELLRRAIAFLSSIGSGLRLFAAAHGFNVIWPERAHNARGQVRSWQRCSSTVRLA